MNMKLGQILILPFFKRTERKAVPGSDMEQKGFTNMENGRVITPDVADVELAIKRLRIENNHLQ